MILMDGKNWINLKLECNEKHTSLSRGYVRKGVAMIEPYDGKFGIGFKVSEHNNKSSQFCYVTYWIKKGDLGHE